MHVAVVVADWGVKKYSYIESPRGCTSLDLSFPISSIPGSSWLLDLSSGEDPRRFTHDGEG